MEYVLFDINSPCPVIEDFIGLDTRIEENKNDAKKEEFKRWRCIEQRQMCIRKIEICITKIEICIMN